MRPLRLCFLWHQHQPDYRDGQTMILPWVRLHGVKDYADLPLQLSKYPSLPHTINVVPSLLAQLDAYAEGAVDEVLALTRRPASDLSDHERERIARHFIVLEQATMTADLPRFAVLVARIGSMGWHALSVGDWLDLQVLYTLAWTGPVHRTQQPVRGLIEKGAGYDEHDKMTLLAFHDSILQSIIPMMRRQRTAGHLELSVTPWNHPILPLLCNTDSARAAMPSAPLPQPAMVARRDAEVHVLRALDDAERRFGVRPEGMWPAEGSISNEALDVMVRAGVRWTASDEAVLRHSLGPLWTSTSALFPRRVITASGSIGVLFRDHDLSDAIGFTYASWEPDRAAQDFVRRLQDRRRRIVLEHGEEMLDHAIVPIMLDGENCWDFYPDNGSRFITALLTQLLDGDQFHVVTCGEATLPEHLQALPDVTSIVAGSWIDGTFDVWIGTPVKNLAWSLLRDARAKFESIESMLDERSAHQTFEHLLVAEGSDWFWWYDDHHQAPHKLTFDLLFRRRLQDAWRSMHLTPPSELDHPLYEAVMLHDNEPSRVAVTYGGSSMHESDLVAHDVRLEHSGDWQRVVLTLRRRPTQDESLTLTIASRDGQERACHITSDGLLWRSPLHDEGVHYLSDLEVAVYVHAGKEWHVRLEEERGAVRSFTTTLR